FFALSAACGKEQYLVPYLMSSHPGCTMDDAARLAVYLKRTGLDPEQVQDFYPTPGTASTVMYYTGLDPFTGREVYAATDYREKQLQRALLQWRRPENRRLIREAMAYCTPAGVKDLEELLSASPGIHRPPAPENGDPGRSGKTGKTGKTVREKGQDRGGRKDRSERRPQNRPQVRSGPRSAGRTDGKTNGNSTKNVKSPKKPPKKGGK
ncbi:MAG: DUF3362 domain-containing protein, partial [Clostridia bacterium]|nr:DUF3362 domain-containing protein [Clostridia bacterium]